MSSFEYLVWFLAMAVLIPVIVLGGITWAYFRGKQQVSSWPMGDTAVPYRPGRDEARGTDRSVAARPVRAAFEDDGSVPDRHIWRWHDDGGAVGSPT